MTATSINAPEYVQASMVIISTKIWPLVLENLKDVDEYVLSRAFAGVRMKDKTFANDHRFRRAYR